MMIADRPVIIARGGIMVIIAFISSSPRNVIVFVPKMSYRRPMIAFLIIDAVLLTALRYPIPFRSIAGY